MIDARLELAIACLFTTWVEGKWLLRLDSISLLPPVLFCRTDFHRISRAGGPSQPVAQIVQCRLDSNCPEPVELTQPPDQGGTMICNCPGLA